MQPVYFSRHFQGVFYPFFSLILPCCVFPVCIFPVSFCDWAYFSRSAKNQLVLAVNPDAQYFQRTVVLSGH